jgi:hypothetical protein
MIGARPEGGGPPVMKDILYEKIEQRLLAKELDPEKSILLGDWSASDHQASLRCETEMLFVSAQGRYFIVYEGGMKAPYHDLPGVESWFGGSYTRAVTVEEAIEWCEETGNLDILREHLPFVVILAQRRSGSTGRTPA